jgi:MSHA pilin protein MshA
MKLGKQQGFTLIELVMVIVILGILAAVALPKFADLSGDARKATLQGAQGSVKSAAAIVHAKALAEGKTGDTGTISLEGIEIGLAFGYPNAASIAAVAGVSSPDYHIAKGEKDKPTTISATKDAGASAVEACNFTYAEPAAVNTAPSISEVTFKGC